MTIQSYIMVNNRKIGCGFSAYVIAEISANHNQNFDHAVSLIQAAKESGADAIKMQTYTPDTITINCMNEYFRIGGDSIWAGKNLYELYAEAYTPWEWQPKLKTIANELGMDFFSTPFDNLSVDFLEKMNVPAYKIASFELVDLPLLRCVAKTGKPIIMSTGMATLDEIEEAVNVIKDASGNQLALLKCTSAYPALPEEMNIRTIGHMSNKFAVPVGLSDHTLSIAVPTASVALGACIIEKHFTMSRSTMGPDSVFSLEPHEFKTMVDAIRVVEKALGKVNYEVTEAERASRVFRRSLFVVKDIKMGEVFDMENVRSIRPGYGLHTRFLDDILGKRSMRDIKKGTPLSWNMVQ